MIETTVPEINVTELMERVRAEAQKPKPPPRHAAIAAESALPLPPVVMLPGAPAVWIPGPVKSKKERLDALVETARERNQASSKIPRFLRGFFRKQGGYNRAVVESVAALAKTTDDLTRRVGEIGTCLGQLNSWMLALHEQSDADANWMKAAGPALSTLASQVKGERQSAARTREEVDRKTTALAEQIAALKQQADATDALAAQLRGGWDAIVNDLGPAGAVRNEIRTVQAAQQDLRSQMDGAATHLRNLQGFVDKHLAETLELQGALEQRLAENSNDTAFVKGELSEYGSLLRRLLGGDRDRPVTSRKKTAAAKGDEHGTARALDSFYFSFENRFRGPPEDIKKRVAFYLPFLRKAGAGTSGRPVLDVGCGRGEWLELLKEQKLQGSGVDLSSAMIAECKARGLKVRMGDAIEHLHSLRAKSVGAITGFHIIEHLPFEVLMDLFSEAWRVLKPGGVAVFESPNCKNLVVGACNFYIDPTHRNPVFPETAEFMLASHGFENVKIEYLSPVADPRFEASTPELTTIKELLYGPQDFGIIAYKPKPR